MPENIINRFVSLAVVIVFFGSMFPAVGPADAWPFDPQMLSDDDNTSSVHPAVSTSCDGENCDYVHVVWVEKHVHPGYNPMFPCNSIFYRRSSDRGNSWDIGPLLISKPHAPTYYPDMCLDAGIPSISVVGTEIYVVWPNQFEFFTTYSDPRRYYHIYLQYSPDNGQTWQSQDTVIDDSRTTCMSYPWPECSWIESEEDVFSPFITASVDATEDYVHADWKVSYNFEVTVYEIRYDRASTSSPLVWGTDQTLASTSPLGRSVDIAAQAQYVHVVYVDDGPQAVYYVRSASNGDSGSWSSSTPITPTYVAYPEFPAINISRGNVHVAWEDWRDYDSVQIYYIMSSDYGLTWVGTGERISDGDIGPGNNNYRPRVASTGATVYVTWSHDSSGERSVVYDWNLHNGGIGFWGTDIIIYPHAVPIPPDPDYPGLSDISLYGNDIHVVWNALSSTYDIPEVFYSNQLDEMVQAGTLPTALKGTASVYAFYPHPAPGGYRVFVIGGESASGLSGDVLIYDPVSDSFDPNPYCTIGGASPGIAYTSAIWDGGDHIYVFGGKRPDGAATDDIWVIDLSDPTSPYRCMVTGAELVRPMYGTSAVFDSINGHAWIFGGYDGTLYYSDIQRWDLVWLNDATTKNYFDTPRAFTSAIIDESWSPPKAYVFGGESGSERIDEIAEVRMPNGGLKEMLATLPTARSRTSAAFDDMYAYVFGGRDDNGPLDEVVRFNVNGDQYAGYVGALPICEKLPMSLEYTSATATINTHAIGGGIRIFGGEGQTGLTDKVEKFSPGYWVP